MIFETTIVRLSKSGVKKRFIELILAIIIGSACVLVYRETQFPTDERGNLFLFLFSQGFMFQCAGLALMNAFSLIGHFMLPTPKPRSEMTILEIQEYYMNIANRKSTKSPLPIIQFLGGLAVLLGFISVGDGFNKSISPANHISAYLVMTIMAAYWSFHVWNRVREFLA